MANNTIKKFLDQQGVTTLWTRIKTELDTRDSSLETKITAEKNRAEGVEATLSADLTKEVQRADAAEKALDTKITEVKTTADAADTLSKANKTAIGTLPENTTDLVSYINKKTEGIASDTALTNLTNRVTTAEGDISTIKNDYLKTADKTELTTAIEAAQKDATQANTDLAAEIKRATAAEKVNADAIALLADGTSPDKIDGVKDLIAYVETHGTEVTGMKGDIKANTEAITKLNGADSVEGSVANKIKAQADADAKVYATKIDVTTADNAITGRLDALEKDTHTHSNLELLNTYTQTNADLTAAVEKKHDHTNKTQLDTITQEKINAWDAAEQNAKNYADTEVYAKITALSTQDIDDAIKAVTTSK